MHLVDWFCRQQGVGREVLLPAFYFHEGEAAVRHIMEVACGLDSMVLLESQILGQMKLAFSESCAAARLGPSLIGVSTGLYGGQGRAGQYGPRRLSSFGVVSCDPVCTGKISDCPVEAHVLLLGAGLTIELALRHLLPLAPDRITIASRHATSAEALLEKQTTKSRFVRRGFERLADSLMTADIVIYGTASPQQVSRPIIVLSQQTLVMVDMLCPEMSMSGG